VHQVGFIYKIIQGMHGQPNIKFHHETFVPNCPVLLRVVAEIGSPHLVSLFLTKVMVQSVWERSPSFYSFQNILSSLAVVKQQ
jgi:hypothetical protein